MICPISISVPRFPALRAPDNRDSRDCPVAPSAMSRRRSGQPINTKPGACRRYDTFWHPLCFRHILPWKRDLLKLDEDRPKENEDVTEDRNPAAVSADSEISSPAVMPTATVTPYAPYQGEQMHPKGNKMHPTFQARRATYGSLGCEPQDQAFPNPQAQRATYGSLGSRPIGSDRAIPRLGARIRICREGVGMIVT